MKAKQRQRLMLVGLILLAVTVGGSLVFLALSENMNLFYSPAEVAAGQAPTAARIRVGGLVEEGSVQRAVEGLRVSFSVTDHTASLPIEYEGILPDLFREGQGIVALGQLNAEGVFVAQQVLAKHDENYMPPEVADALAASEAKPQAASTQGGGL